MGKTLPIFRSSWERRFMQMADEHDAILYWSSESIKIPYKNPINGRSTVYVPDFAIVYLDANGQQHSEVVEIKPSSQLLGEAKGAYDKLHAVINAAKWEAAQIFCKKHNMRFRVITEKDIFSNPSRPRTRRKGTRR